VPFETRDCHPTPPLISFASTLPLQGRVKKGAPCFYLGPTILVRSDISPSNAITMSSPGCR
jgi:hypothetical protein